MLSMGVVINNYFAVHVQRHAVPWPWALRLLIWAPLVAFYMEKDDPRVDGEYLATMLSCIQLGTGPQLPNCQTQCHFSWLVVSPLRQKVLGVAIWYLQ